jgi:DNA adenine methylase
VTLDDPVSPFLKWPGGKRWASGLIVKLIRRRLTNTYYEPFLGGGSVFFALRPQRAVLSDVNADLINTYKMVKTRSSALVPRLKRLRVDQVTFECVRQSQPDSEIERAVRFLYLNRTAFGGIYRVNLSGKFNVPFGGGERTPAPLWERGLLADAASALRKVRISHADFESVINRATGGDVVYCDPTYTVTHGNNGFIRYNERNFSWADQERLACAAKRASDRGAAVIITNASHPAIHEIYSGARVRVLRRKSLVSTDITKRRSVQELLICIEPAYDRNSD